MTPQELDIRTLLPQRDPMVMVDRLLSADPSTAVTALDVRADNLFVENGVLPAYALIENMAQTCAAQLGYVDRYVSGAEGVKIGYIGSVKRMRTERSPRVGETVTTKVQVLEDFADMKMVQAVCAAGNEEIATAELVIALSGERSVL